MEVFNKLVMNSKHILNCNKFNMWSVLLVMNSGNVDVMKALARVWAPCQMQKDWIEDTLEELKNLENIDVIRIISDSTDANVQMADALKQKYERYVYFPLRRIVSGVSGERWRVRRQVHALLAILVLRCGDSRRADYAECRRFFNRTIPDDFVTLPEIRDELVRILNDSEIGNPGRPVSDFMARLEELYPESTGYRVPRKLLHLCRVRINSGILKSGKTLPEGVPSLNIPGVIKDYLLFDCDN